jgi:hypothetical protein
MYMDIGIGGLVPRVEISVNSGLGRRFVRIVGKYSRPVTIVFAFLALLVEVFYPAASIYFSAVTFVSAMFLLKTEAYFKIEIAEEGITGVPWHELDEEALADLLMQAAECDSPAAVLDYLAIEIADIPPKEWAATPLRESAGMDLIRSGVLQLQRELGPGSPD